MIVGRLMVTGTYRNLGLVFTQCTILNEKPPGRIHVARGGGWQRYKQHQGLIICGQKFCQEYQYQVNKEKSSNGPSRNRSLTMLESWEASMLSIWKIWSSKKPGKMREKNWNCLWIQPSLVRFRSTSGGNFVAIEPTLADQSMHASLKLMNLRESVRKDSSSHHNLAHKFIPMPQAMKIPEQKQVLK